MGLGALRFTVGAPPRLRSPSLSSHPFEGGRALIACLFSGGFFLATRGGTCGKSSRGAGMAPLPVRPRAAHPTPPREPRRLHPTLVL